MSTEVEGNNNVTSDRSIFCLLCNSSLDQLESPDNEEQTLVLVNSPGGTNQHITGLAKSAGLQDENEGTGAMDTDDSGGGTGTVALITKGHKSDAEWIRKYQTFMSKTFQLNFEDVGGEDDLEAGSKPVISGVGGTEPKEEEVAMFCHKCKTEVERLYNANEEVHHKTKVFEEIRDSIAVSIVRTFVDRRLEGPDDEEGSEEVDMEEVKNNKTDELLEKWKHIYTGEADKELKERNLISEIREEAIARNEVRSKTEFPEGTGLSAMELAKMQRMMTACYFTPKMSILRKKGKLFFRVGIPRTDKDKTYNCLVCQEVFNYQSSLNVHMRRHKTHHPGQNLVHACQTCAEVFKDRKDLILHKRSQHAGTIDGPRLKYQRVQEFHTCGICSCKFSSKAGRNSHIKKYHPTEKLFTCTLCQDIFTSETTLKEHIVTSHTRTTRIVNNGDHPAEIYTCEDCSKEFLKVKSFLEHRKVHTDTNLTECYYCGRGFTTLEGLQHHTNVTHTDPNPFNCEGCDERFGTEGDFSAHMKTHRFKTFMCETCGRVSRSKEAFKKHLLTHSSSGKVHLCEICNVSFSDKDTLELHLTKHVPTLPYKCDICGDEEGFKDAKDLRKHKVEAHPESVEYLHTCPVCWNGFTTEEALQEHNTQTHERFKCQVCQKVFKMNDHLSRHMHIHTGEKPYQCSICNKSFNQESNLKEHMYRHQGFRPHRCPHCPEVAYLRRVHLKEHMSQEHGLSVDDVPTLPIGRAAQNARKAGTYPMPNETNAVTPEDSSRELVPGTATAGRNRNIQMISLGPSLLPNPLIVNDVTIRADGVHDEFAPLIMKSLQNKSNQPVIVRRGIQVPDSTKSPYIAAIQIKSDGITTDGQIIEAWEGSFS